MSKIYDLISSRKPKANASTLKEACWGQLQGSEPALRLYLPPPTSMWARRREGSLIPSSGSFQFVP